MTFKFICLRNIKNSLFLQGKETDSFLVHYGE